MYKSWGLPVWGNKHLSGDMNLMYMYLYMYINKMVYCGSAKMVKNGYQLCHY
jgi:hypothetical protein